MPQTVTTQAEARPKGKALRILYADDVLELRELLKMILAQNGHTVESAVNGLEALDKISQNPAAFDLVITDHHMPRMDGLELVRRLRQMKFPGRIMVFSSELSPAIADAYLNLEVDHLLTKPINPSVLREKIAAF